MRRTVEERLGRLREAAEQSTANRIEARDAALGIVTSSIAYQYVREVFPEASVLKLGWCYPFPDGLIRQFAGQVNKLLVVEELDDFLEEHIKALGIACEGKRVVPGVGELSPTRLRSARAAIRGPARACRPGGGRRGRSAGPAAGALSRLPASRGVLRAGPVRCGGDGGHRLLQPGGVPAAQPHGHHPVHGRRRLDAAGFRKGRGIQKSGGHRGRTRHSSTPASPA